MSSHCQYIRSLLDDWLDGALDAQDSQVVNDHLRACDTCRAEFERHTTIADDLATLGLLADRIASDSVPRSTIASRWLRWRAGLAAAAVLLLGLSLTLSQSRRNHNTAIPTRGNFGEPTLEDPTTRQTHDFSITTPADKLAVQHKSNNPRIHIVWFYNEVSQPSPSLQDATSSPNNPPSQTRR